MNFARDDTNMFIKSRKRNIFNDVHTCYFILIQHIVTQIRVSVIITYYMPSFM